jgi:hypothetical protein
MPLTGSTKKRPSTRTGTKARPASVSGLDRLDHRTEDFDRRKEGPDRRGDGAGCREDWPNRRGGMVDRREDRIMAVTGR